MRIVSDYRCTNCDTVTEHWATQEEAATESCPSCGSTDKVRMIGAPPLNYTMMVANGEASSDAMQTGIDKWEKMRRQKAQIEKRQGYVQK